jgi:hypothetical protein
MPPKASAAKKERLTLAQLCSYDDILTDALVDQVSVSCLRRLILRPLLNRDTGILLDQNSQEPECIPFISGHP